MGTPVGSLPHSHAGRSQAWQSSIQWLHIACMLSMAIWLLDSCQHASDPLWNEQLLACCLYYASLTLWAPKRGMLTLQRCLRMSGMAVDWGPMASLYRRMLEVMDWVNQNRLMFVSSSSLLMHASSSPSTHRHIFSMIHASSPAHILHLQSLPLLSQGLRLHSPPLTTTFIQLPVMP